MDQKLTLFTTADTHYLTGAVVTLVSAIKNCGPSLQLDLHLLQSGLSEDEKLRFKQTLAPFLGRHTLSVDDIDMELLHSLPIANGYLNALTYARLLIPGMFPDLDRALYLDSDIIVGKDLSALAELDMGGHLLAAVRDIRRTFGKSKDHEVFATLGFDPDSPYFAAGFLLMNLRQWRKEGTFQRCMEFFREHGKLFRQEDQTALNIVAHGRWLRLPRSWNFLVIIRRDRARFRHFVPVNYHTILQFKPWRFDRSSPCEIVGLFYHYLDMTDWERFRVERVEYSCRSPRYRVALRRTRVHTVERILSTAGRLLGREILRRA